MNTDEKVAEQIRRLVRELEAAQRRTRRLWLGMPPGEHEDLVDELLWAEDELDRIRRHVWHAALKDGIDHDRGGK